MVLVVGQRVDIIVVDCLDAVGAEVEVAGVGQVERVDVREIGLVSFWCGGSEMRVIVVAISWLGATVFSTGKLCIY